MNQTIVNGKAEAVSEAEATLRLIASLPAPEGIAERLKAGLAAVEAAPKRGRVLAWPAKSSMAQGGWLQGAAAAALLLAMAGGGWSAYKWVAPAPALQTLPSAARPVLQGGFSAAGAMRRPETLVGPIAPAVTNQVTKMQTGTAGKHGKRAEKGDVKQKAAAETR
ncbi:MAG: hypothetical protein P4L03_07360 [Terracidiphilus sp.]|nr:hypothetical protein [Terracidiphilus sp.]